MPGSMGDGAEFEAGGEKLVNEAGKPGIFVSNCNKTEYKKTRKSDLNFKSYGKEVTGCVNSLTRRYLG